MTRLRSWPAALLALAPVLASLAACAWPVSSGTVTVMASWTGVEEAHFKAVLNAFEQREHIQYDYQGTRALGEVLQSSVQRRSVADVVVSSPSDLTRYQRAGAVHPLDDVIGPGSVGDYDSRWLLPLQGHPYAVPLKANLKSIVWYDPSVFPAGRRQPPAWNDLPAGPSTWCMGLGDAPNSGWPGADWIEDTLLRQSGKKAYNRWTAGQLEWTSPEMRQAWTFLGDLVTQHVQGGPRTALFTDFGAAGAPLFDKPPGCMLEHQGSFAIGFYGQAASKPKPDTDFDFFPLPSFGTPGGDARSQVMQPDLAAMFNDKPEARALIRFLASPEAQRIWPQIKGGGAFSLSKRVGQDVYADGVSKRISEALTGGQLCFEARSLMPPVMDGAFDRAMLEYLSDSRLGQPNARQDLLNEILGNLDAVRGSLPADSWPSTPAC